MLLTNSIAAYYPDFIYWLPQVLPPKLKTTVMAKLKKSVLGKVTGAVGDLVFRMRNGNNFIGMRPVSFMPGTDVKSVARRSRFGMAGKFARFANKLPYIKALWKKIVNGSIPYNALLKRNYYYVSASGVSDLATLSPDLGFEISATVTKSSTEVSVDIAAVGSGTGIDTVRETHFVLCGVLYLSGKKDDSYQNEAFFALPFAKVVLNLVNPLEFTYQLSDVEKQLFDRYTNAKGFFSLLSLNADDEPVHFSNTVVG